VGKQYEVQCLEKINKIIGSYDYHDEDSSGITATVFETSIEEDNTLAFESSACVIPA